MFMKPKAANFGVLRGAWGSGGGGSRRAALAARRQGLGGVVRLGPLACPKSFPRRVTFKSRGPRREEQAAWRKREARGIAAQRAQAAEPRTGGWGAKGVARCSAV